MPNRVQKPQPLLLLVAGAKGAVASTVAVAIAAMQQNSGQILPSLTTGEKFDNYLIPNDIHLAGWDPSAKSLAASISDHGVLPAEQWKPYSAQIDEVAVLNPPSMMDFESQVDQVFKDMQFFRNKYPNYRAVFVNLLPAAENMDLTNCQSIQQLSSSVDPHRFPDFPYVVAAILSGIPVVNFTSNAVELPAIVNEAGEQGVPISGRDGKTGQTFLKVVLASALKERKFLVNGWYSLNLLGNSDGENLMDSSKVGNKLENKAKVLDDILGPSVSKETGGTCHKIRIDYYPPRGDKKEAWDVIDFQGLFGLPMSIRVDFQGRDSILAAPLVIDLARWMGVLHMAGRSGPVPELAFYFKKAIGDNPPLNFQDQIASLNKLESECYKTLSRDEG